MCVMADLTEEEKARYDRQIRVWGAEAQTRIQNAKILVVGLNGLHPEVVKNVVRRVAKNMVKNVVKKF